MKKSILIVSLTLSVFSLGVLADEAIKPTGRWWQKISETRRLGYVEGFDAGEFTAMTENHCGHEKLPSIQATEACILYRLRQRTLVDVSTAGTLTAISQFYASPQNLPVHWGHAVIIAEGMVSGVPVGEKDLELIRQADAR